MSVLGIATTIASQFDALVAHSKSSQRQQGFQQLGQDLQSGNISQAQSDFVSLNQLLPGGQQFSTLALSSVPQSTNPLATAVSQLAQDLKSGNLSAAQTDLTTVQQYVQQAGQQKGTGQAHHHHHHQGPGDASQSTSQQTPISTLFGELGQSLQSGNIAAAQQAYSTLQQEFQQFGLPVTSDSSSSPTISNFSVSA